MMDKPLLQDGKQWVLMTTKTAIDHDVEQNGSERDQEGKDRIKDMTGLAKSTGLS